MLKDFHLIHRRKPHMFSPADSLVWETCLRSIAFTLDPAAVPSGQHDENFTNADAYKFLLEVICGLHSPVLGETEVFGQFKNFAKEWVARQPQRVALVQRLFTEAKEIRSKHLCNLGTQSYGSWLKRKVQSRQLHILGGGNLVQEIAPYLVKISESVTIHVRNPEKVNIKGVIVKPLSANAFNGGGLIVAAPLAAREIQLWLSSVPEEIFDLRDNSVADPISAPAPRQHVLRDVFSEIERTKALLAPIVEVVKSEILARSERIASQAHVRPQGWDDLCA